MCPASFCERPGRGRWSSRGATRVSPEEPCPFSRAHCVQIPGKAVPAFLTGQLAQVLALAPFLSPICEALPHPMRISSWLSHLCPRGRPSASECLQSPWLQETGLDNRQQALVTFPTTKLRNFLTEREKKRGLLCSKYGLMIAQWRGCGDGQEWCPSPSLHPAFGTKGCRWVTVHHLSRAGCLGLCTSLSVSEI